MKNKKFIKSLDNILPDYTRKKIIYENIFKHKKNNFFKYSLVLITACFCLVLYPGKNLENRALPARSLNVFYNDICYEEYKEYTGSKKNLILIKEKLLFNNQAYQIKESKNIVIYTNKFIEYRKCGEIKE